MSRAIPVERFATAVLKGIGDAQRQYEAWSGGDWLWEAPEYLSTVYAARGIATALRKKETWYLTLEHGAASAIRDAGARGRGRLHKRMRPDGRIDLLLWSGGGKPRAPIEIKRHVQQFRGIHADTLRIDKMIHRSRAVSSIQFGMIAFYTSCKRKTADRAAAEIERRVETIRCGAANAVAKSTKVDLRMGRIRKVKSENSAWTVAILTFRRIPVIKEKRME